GNKFGHVSPNAYFGDNYNKKIMRQGVFVSLNEEKWKNFENKLKAVKSLPANELSYMYVHLTEDLAYAQGKYPDSQLALYLNELTVKVHNTIYRNKPEKASRFV